MARFMTSNPGLASRFPTTVRFPDYTDDELLAIFVVMTAAAGYELENFTQEYGYVDERVIEKVREAAASTEFCREVASIFYPEILEPGWGS